MSIVANDCYGFPLKVGDFVVSVKGSDLSGEIMDISYNENYPWITVKDKEHPKPTNGLNPESFTTPERLAENKKNVSNNYSTDSFF